MLEIPKRAVGGMDFRVIGNVVSVVPPGRRKERQQPDGSDAEVLQIIELAAQPAKIPHAVAVAVIEGADMHFIDDCVFIPERIALKPGGHDNSRLADTLQMGNVTAGDSPLSSETAVRVDGTFLRRPRSATRLQRESESWTVPELS